MKRPLRWMAPAGAIALVATAAYAWIERSPKQLPAKRGGTTVACAQRVQAVTHGSASDPVHLFLDLYLMNAQCLQLDSNGGVSGVSHVGLVKLENGELTFCTTERVVANNAHGRVLTKEYPNAPCGPGEYLVASCSERLTTTSAAGTAETQEDCSNILNWTWTPRSNPHPIW